MLVRDRMTTTVRTVPADTPYNQALQALRDFKVRRLPVVNARGQIVGIVSEQDLLNAAPSTATSLSRYEIPELLAHLRVSEIMTRNVTVIEPQVPIEEAARLMADNKIGSLPVVDEQQALVGIITETDIFRTMVEMLGARSSGLRVTFSVADQRAILAQLIGEITRQNGSIITIGVFRGANPQQPTIMIKVKGADQERLVAMLRGRGANIIDVRQV